MDDAVDGLRVGDSGSFRAVYETYAPVVLGYLKSRGSRDPEALTQDVFLTVFRRVGDLEGGEVGLRRFLFSVAHARLVDELRQAARRPASSGYSAEEDPRTHPAAEDEAQERLDHEWVVSLISTLPEGQRDVVALRVVADLSLEETAAVVGRSVGAVKQLQRRGLIALREAAQKGGVTR